MNKKLSKTQQELLNAMRAGVRVHYMPYRGWFNPVAYYFRSDTHKRCTAAADALVEKGYAQRVGGVQQTLQLLDSPLTVDADAQ